jgi:type I restriction enzyme S subunit
VSGGLPRNWTLTELGTLIDGFEAGRNLRAHGHPAGANEFGVLKVSAVSWGRFNPVENKALFAGDVPRSKELVRKGDLLISRANTTELVGAVVLVNEDHPWLMLPDKVLRLRVRNSVIVPEFLLRALRIRSVRKYFEVNGTGTSDSMRNLSQPKIEGAPILLPPLMEQRRIVAKLEALQARSRRACEALDAVPPLLEKLRQSILAAAFRGDLTKDWRARHKNVEPASKLLERIRAERRKKWEEGELAKMTAKGTAPKNNRWKATYEEPGPSQEKELPLLPDGWCWATSAELVAGDADVVYGIVQPGPIVAGGVPYVRGMDIEDGRILEHQLLRTHPDIAARYERASLLGGDVLLGIIRATKVAVVPDSLAGANITQGTARFRPAPGLMTDFLAGWLDGPWAQSWLHAKYRGIDMPGLNLRDVRRLPVPLAPAEEQKEVIRELQSALAHVAVLRRTSQECARLGAQLDSSLLAKAFRGELVPQDPNDEPAEAMLARLRGANGAATSEPRAKRGRRSASAHGQAATDE